MNNSTYRHWKYGFIIVEMLNGKRVSSNKLVLARATLTPRLRNLRRQIGRMFLDEKLKQDEFHTRRVRIRDRSGLRSTAGVHARTESVEMTVYGR